MFHIRSRRHRLASAKRDSRRRWLVVSSTACSALALLAAACGGTSGDGEPSAREPAIPADVADRLADDAAEVAALVAAADNENARAKALELRDEAEDAIAEGDVPRALVDELRAAVNRLLAQIPVVEDVPEEPAEEEEEQKNEDDKGKSDEKDKGDEKDEDKGKGNDDTLTDVTTVDTTETDVGSDD